MKAAVGQFVVTPDWQQNLATCQRIMARAQDARVDLLVLPEALLARDDNDPHLSVKSAQPLDGAYMKGLLVQSHGSPMTTVLTIHVPSGSGRATNTLVAIRQGEILAHYHKLHLYDAFSIQESQKVDPGQTIAPLIDVAGMKVGLMTCYDLRFPELALSLALAGAEVLAVPAAWVKGPLKEHHWSILLSARALDTTCYMVASGECGNRNIGQSKIISPSGVGLAGLGTAPGLSMADLDGAEVAEVRRQLPVLTNRRFAPPQLK